ncbi:MAG: IS21-like element helper ATPase IstB [Candidatus Kapabacteria bacterium]|jgi:DNA replication protein DnaC|nr:IS21-like element helper ATPase IstB [Candidatus Kapabacteria bacterium]MDT3740716.1 IS21-like element helper ATPase IstB [Candidatus Kapabacteria bacterium]
MNNNATLEKLKLMKLKGMADAFQAAVETRSHQDMTADDLVAYIVEAEYNDRNNRKICRSIETARFRYNASIEEIDFHNQRNLDKNNLLRLADLSFITNRENIIITGKTGVGKSFLASALGHKACVNGYKVMYFNTGKLFSKLKMSGADNSYMKEIKKIEQQDLIILDDFGLQVLDLQSRLYLLEILEDRHSKRSTIITSQLPVAKWYEIIDDETIADAILDRVVHSSHRIELKGESLRKIINK